MARFPVTAGKVQITTVTAATDIVQNGVLLEGNFASARMTKSGGTQWQNGLFLTPLSQVIYVDATAGLPAGTQWVNGLPISSLGELCISSDSVFTWRDGLPFVANGALAVGSLTDPLARFWAGGVAGKKVLMFGDSTTQVASEMWNAINAQITSVGGELAGCTFVNGGQNGQSQQGANTDLPTWVYAVAPNLLVSCFGINDVRLGFSSAATLAANITTMVTGTRTNLPNCDIVLWTPNSLGSNDPQAYGYVQPPGSYQAYTDQMWNAYNNLVGLWDHTVWIDKMQVFNRTCQPVGTLLLDQLHPNNLGQTQALIPLINRIKPPVTPINLVASAAAWASNPNNPWTVYSRALEDTRYCTVVKKVYCDTWLDTTPTYLYYWTPRWDDPAGSIQVADLQPLDFVGSANGNCQLTGSENKGNLDARRIQIQIPIANGAPSNTPSLSYLTIYRKVP